MLSSKQDIINWVNQLNNTLKDIEESDSGNDNTNLNKVRLEIP